MVKTILVSLGLLALTLFGAAAFLLSKGIAKVCELVVSRLIGRRPHAVAVHTFSITLAVSLLVYLPVEGLEHVQVEGYRKAVPPEFGRVDVEYHDGQSGLREGCGFVVFRLPSATVSRIRNEGLTFLQSARRGRGGQRYQQYGPWKTTPAGGHEDLLRGIGCAQKGSEWSQRVAGHILSEGAFFTTGHEVDLVVIPSLGLLVYSYFG